jgi:antitoxin component YwqK of YwqJK toxin-antitoxin module
MLSTPSEILIERIFTFISTDDITSCLKTCKEMRDLVKQNGKYIYSICGHIQPHGTVEKFHNNKKLQSTCEYKDGKMCGPIRTWYKCGATRSYEPHRDGKCDGTLYSYYRNGNEMTEINYKNGKKHGRQLHYTPSKRLFDEQHFRDDIKTGKHRLWDSYSGELREVIEYRDGIGKQIYPIPPITFEEYSKIDTQTRLKIGLKPPI